MNNKVAFVNKNQFKELSASNEASLKIIIDGKEIHSWSDYWNVISEAFSFPELPSYMKPDYHSYYDLMTDLSWIKSKNIVLIIKNSDKFLADDLKLRNIIIKDFKDNLLPFWEEEVLKTVVEGEARSFCVYFVD